MSKDPVDLYNQATKFHNGQGVQKDYAEALRLYKLAADQGYPNAQCNLGLMYHNGLGAKQDYIEALRLFRLAADQGYATAQNNLGLMYYHGFGVKQDFLEALRLYKLASDQGLLTAYNNLGMIFKYGRGVKKDYSEAVRLFTFAADRGYANAQYNLASLYKKGRGVKQDFDEAIRLYRLAADQGLITAQNHLGLMFKYGRGVKRDYNEAVRLFKLAADHGSASARYNLASLYIKGQGVKQDYGEAILLFKLAADQGYAKAQGNLACLFEKGEGTTQDYSEAFRLYKLAAEQGNANAQYHLATMYENGNGVKQDCLEALKWYKLAAGQGDTNSQNKVALLMSFINSEQSILNTNNKEKNSSETRKLLVSYNQENYRLEAEIKSIEALKEKILLACRVGDGNEVSQIKYYDVEFAEWVVLTSLKDLPLVSKIQVMVQPKKTIWKSMVIEKRCAAFLVGISNYESEDFKDYRNLYSCTNDVKQLSAVLRETRRFKPEHVKEYYNLKKSDIMSKLEEFNETVVKKIINDGFTPNIFFYFSGHGFIVDGIQFLVANLENFNPKGGDKLLNHCIHFETEIQTRLALYTTGVKLVIIDACRYRKMTAISTDVAKGDIAKEPLSLESPYELLRKQILQEQLLAGPKISYQEASKKKLLTNFLISNSTAFGDPSFQTESLNYEVALSHYTAKMLNYLKNNESIDVTKMFLSIRHELLLMQKDTTPNQTPTETNTLLQHPEELVDTLI